MNRLRVAVGVLSIAILSGCQSMQAVDDKADVSLSHNVRVDRYYALMMPGDTNLRDVTDDGINMYLDFVEPVDIQTRFFDDDGAELVVVQDDAFVGIAGLHNGVLIKNQNGSSSYVAVRAGASRDTAPKAANTPAIALMRGHLVDQMAAAQAMIRAMAALAANEQGTRDAAKNAAHKASRDAASVVATDKKTVKVLRLGVAPKISARLRDEARRTPTVMKVFFGFDQDSRQNRLPRGPLISQLRQAASLFITGYTDSSGPSAYNLALGLSRAESVATGLVKKGVKRSIMTVRSRGESDFIADNLTPASRAKNRRVEVRLLPY